MRTVQACSMKNFTIGPGEPEGRLAPNAPINEIVVYYANDQGDVPNYAIHPTKEEFENMVTEEWHGFDSDVFFALIGKEHQWETIVTEFKRIIAQSMNVQGLEAEPDTAMMLVGIISPEHSDKNLVLATGFDGYGAECCIHEALDNLAITYETSDGTHWWNLDSKYELSGNLRNFVGLHFS